MAREVTIEVRDDSGDIVSLVCLAAADTHDTLTRTWLAVCDLCDQRGWHAEIPDDPDSAYSLGYYHAPRIPRAG